MDCLRTGCLLHTSDRLQTFFTLNTTILNSCKLDLLELDQGHVKESVKHLKTLKVLSTQLQHEEQLET